MAVYLAGVRVLAALAASALCVTGVLATAPTLVPATAPTGPGGGPPLALTGFDPHGDYQTPGDLLDGSHTSTGTPGAEPTQDHAVSGLTESAIPYVALRAYKAAANSLARTDPACGLDWALLAAIGRVESNHGRYGGAALRAGGTVTAPIYGPTLFQIDDSDGGRLDGDANYDRAVGPMQFLPGTWAGYGADGNGDGHADPQNIEDAALAAGRYLCAGDTDLAHHPGAAVYRYNHSTEYVALVLSLAESYRSGDAPQLRAAGGGPTGGATEHDAKPGDRHDKASERPGSHAPHPSGPGKGGGKGGGNGGGTGNVEQSKDPSKPPSESGSRSPTDGSSQSSTRTPSESTSTSGTPSESSSEPGTPSESSSEPGTESPTSTPTASECGSPTPSSSASKTPKRTPTATGKHTTSPTPTTCPTDKGSHHQAAAKGHR